jgi:2-dehydropantoate 2-reductase
MKKILVYGAGAIGGYLGAILTDAGEEVTLVARGAQWEALATRGMILEGPLSGRDKPVRVKVVRPGEEKPPYDLIFVTLKSHQLVGAAQHVRSLGDSHTTFVFPQNGIPWWYFEGLDLPLAGTRLKTLDPEGILSSTFDIRQVVGAIAFKPSDLIAPGRIRLADSETDALILGEVDHQMSPRLEAIAQITTRAGWVGKPVSDIRLSKWTKLLSNAVWNTMGALTQSSATQAVHYEPTKQLAIKMTEEVIALANAVGSNLKADPLALMAASAKRVSLPSSTLQDVRAGRSLELDALINVLLEMGVLTGISTPHLQVVAACANLLNQRICEDKVSFKPQSI